MLPYDWDLFTLSIDFITTRYMYLPRNFHLTEPPYDRHLFPATPSYLFASTHNILFLHNQPFICSCILTTIDQHHTSMRLHALNTTRHLYKILLLHNHPLYAHVCSRHSTNTIFYVCLHANGNACYFCNILFYTPTSFIYAYIITTLDQYPSSYVPACSRKRTNIITL